jgi:hypothetical protein
MPIFQRNQFLLPKEITTTDTFRTNCQKFRKCIPQSQRRNTFLTSLIFRYFDRYFGLEFDFAIDNQKQMLRFISYRIDKLSFCIETRFEVRCVVFVYVFQLPEKWKLLY